MCKRYIYFFSLFCNKSWVGDVGLVNEMWVEVCWGNLEKKLFFVVGIELVLVFFYVFLF